MRGGFFAFITTRKPKARMKWAKRGRDYLRVLEYGEQVLARNPWDSGTQLDMAAAADALGLLDVAIFILTQARRRTPRTRRSTGHSPGCWRSAATSRKRSSSGNSSGKRRRATPRPSTRRRTSPPAKRFSGASTTRR